MANSLSEEMQRIAMHNAQMAANPPVVTGSILGGGGGGVYYDVTTDSYIDTKTGQRLSHQYAPPFTQADPTPQDLHRSGKRLEMIKMRLRNGWTYQHLDTAYVGDKVYVFVIQNDQPVILEDDATMFPSDQLTTQLRLIGK